MATALEKAEDMAREIRYRNFIGKAITAEEENR